MSNQNRLSSRYIDIPEEKYAEEYKDSYQNIFTDSLLNLSSNSLSEVDDIKVNFQELSLTDKKCVSSRNPNDEFENMMLESAKQAALSRFGELFIRSNTVTVVEFYVFNNKINKRKPCRFVIDVFTTDACYFTKNSAKMYDINYDTNYSNHYVCGLIPYMDLFPTLRYPKESSDVACPMLVIDRIIPGDIDGILSQNFLIKYDGILSYKKNTLTLLDDIVIDVKIEELK